MNNPTRAILVVIIIISLGVLAVGGVVTSEDSPSAASSEDFFAGCVIGHISLLKEFGFPRQQIEDNLPVIDGACKQLEQEYQIRNRHGLEKST